VSPKRPVLASPRLTVCKPLHLESVQTGDLDEARDQLAELEPLQAWLALERFDRRQVNRRLTLYALGDEAWRWE
jgi:hypothetical protein